MAKILIVDDSDSVRQQLRKDLEQGGHTTIEAKDGLDGIEKFKSNSDVQVVLADVNMPNMDGLTMVQNLSQVSHYKNAAVLMLTTEANEAMKKQAKEYGVRAWIVKPYVPAKVLAAIDAITKKK